MQRVEFRQPRAAYIVAAALAVIVPLVLLALMLPGWLRLAADGAAPLYLFGALMALVVLAVGVYALRLSLREFRDPRPVLLLDERGVSSRALRCDVLPWADIAEAYGFTKEIGDGVMGEMLGIRLADPASLLDVIAPERGLVGWLVRREALRSGAVEINLAGTGADVEGLAAAMNAHLARVHSGGGRRRRPMA